jgi:anti-sigma B factor antagonist
MEGVEFELVTDASPAGTRIAVRGDLDLATVGAFREAVDAALGRRAPVVLVLEECTFLDSSALKAIADASRRAEEAGFPFAVSRPSSPAARVLEVSGLNEVVTIEPGE